jgi:hypothetical protein
MRSSAALLVALGGTAAVGLPPLSCTLDPSGTAPAPPAAGKTPCPEGAEHGGGEGWSMPIA